MAARTLNPDNVARLDLLLNGLGKEEVGLAVREPVGLVKLDLARVVCAAGCSVSSTRPAKRGPSRKTKCAQWKKGQRIELEKPL